jgi:hypothetical protein
MGENIASAEDYGHYYPASVSASSAIIDTLTLLLYHVRIYQCSQLAQVAQVMQSTDSQDTSLDVANLL